MRSRKISSLAIYALTGFFMLRPLIWAKDDMKLTSDLELGKHIVVPRNADVGRCMTSPGQLDKCVNVTANGIKYTVGFRRRGSRGNVVTYVHTDDPNFRSPEGLSVGDMVTVENPESIVAAPGFEIYSRKGRGWIPVVGFNGEVNVVHDGQTDEKREAKTLRPVGQASVRLRIRGFTKRGTPTATGAEEGTEHSRMP
jgi:hypothetical protein